MESKLFENLAATTNVAKSKLLKSWQAFVENEDHYAPAVYLRQDLRNWASDLMHLKSVFGLPPATFKLAFDQAFENTFA